MSMSALDEAGFWTDQLMEAEAKGRRDKEAAVRHRLAKKIGVQESYLFRLQYKIQEMTDVKGSAYKALSEAFNKYRHQTEARRIRNNEETQNEIRELRARLERLDAQLAEMDQEFDREPLAPQGRKGGIQSRYVSRQGSQLPQRSAPSGGASKLD